MPFSFWNCNPHYVACAGYEVDTLASVPVLGGVYSTGNTCLHLAAQNGHLDMVECLIERGANPRLIDYRWAWNKASCLAIIMSYCSSLKSES